MSNSQLYKGSLQTIILNLLKEEGKMYGYEITQKIKLLSSNDLNIKEGALYPALHKLEAQGYLTTSAKRVDNRVRKYYELTVDGETETVNRIQELKNYLQDMEQLLHLKPRMA
ncbi:MAG: PadR family transcriptional regulator [Nonlabens sp.]